MHLKWRLIYAKIMKRRYAMQKKLKTARGDIIFELEYKNVKNVNLRVKRNGQIYVSANRRVPIDFINTFVLSKADFIFAALERIKIRAEAAPKHEYISGEKICIFGKTLTIEISAARKPFVAAEGEVLRVCLNNPENEEARRKTIEKWCRATLREVTEALCSKVYPAFALRGIEYPEIKFRNMRSRYGSCQTKKHILTFAYDLISAPLSSIEYVVMHEFVHFIHPNHSKSFHDTMTELMPDWKSRRRILISSCR